MRAAGSPTLTATGLFAGIGGVELGLSAAGIEPALLCDVWEPAQLVLQARFPTTPLATDVRTLETLPPTDIVTAGFPCTDLSQAGRTAGITGSQSSLVGQVFRLLDGRTTQLPTWVVFENVRNLLPLDGGRGMAYLVGELERRGYRWAYRVVDSRFSGVPQRRQRVLIVASRTSDPRAVLFADDAGEPDETEHYADDAFGFYWTEGVRGLGWARDAVPTLKGGSAFGIPSPPAIWLPGQPLERRFVTPSIVDVERLQGFPPGWTTAAEPHKGRSPQWKLLGNAVTASVAEWLGRRLVSPGTYDNDREEPLDPGHRWPNAAYGEVGRRRGVRVSLWPERVPYRHLTSVIDVETAKPLSERAARGFLRRTTQAKLRFDPDFLLDIDRYAEQVGS